MSSMHFPFALANAGRQVAGKPGVIVENRTLPYTDFDREAQRLALELIGAGVNPGDCVAVHMYNGIELAVGYFGCWYAGAIAVPLNAQMQGPEIEYVLRHSDAVICLGCPKLCKEIEHIRPRLPIIWQCSFGWDLQELRPGRIARMALPTLVPDRPVPILYTSGTTARPKGVVHTHSSLHSCARCCDMREDDVVVIFTSMAHSAAFMMLIASVAAGATVVTVPEFEADWR